MSRQVGLKDIYVALLTTDSATEIVYATPTPLERAINAKITPKYSSENWYSEDSVEDIITAFEGVDVEIELNQLSLKSRALLQGLTVVSGEIEEGKDDNAPYVALGFRSKKKSGKYRYVWLYKGKFEPASDEYETEGEKPKGQTAKLKASFVARENDGKFRRMSDEDEVDVDAAKIAAWFTSVIPVEA